MKKFQSREEIQQLMKAREIYRAGVTGKKICVVLPNHLSCEQVLGNHYLAMKSRLSKKNIVIVCESDLQDNHLEDAEEIIEYC